MAFGLFLAFDPPFITPGPRADSQLLAALAMLEDICSEWGVRPLSSYLDQGGRPEGQPRSDWHAIETGLQTMATLAHHPVCAEGELQAELLVWLRQLEYAREQGIAAFRIEAGHGPD
ncbi:hypothetical protein [Chitinilyticum litopenaei]|uniref:hypothetical protein n=1 Tax=Chitinilyticum litopenaei TaxID=1121276 RepID=UPI000408534F|nr:hypothetical protein [Chitinilyticum litopenaei]